MRRQLLIDYLRDNEVDEIAVVMIWKMGSPSKRGQHVIKGKENRRFDIRLKFVRLTRIFEAFDLPSRHIFPPCIRFFLRVSDVFLRASDCFFRVSDFSLSVSQFFLRVSDFSLRVSNFSSVCQSVSSLYQIFPPCITILFLRVSDFKSSVY